jgi:hypothetical protein
MDKSKRVLVQECPSLSLFFSLKSIISTLYTTCRFRSSLIPPFLKLFFQVVPTAKGQALADEFGIQFFETVCSCYDV